MRRQPLSNNNQGEQGQLDDSATTIALLKLNAVVGVTASSNPDGSVQSMGIQCAFCHSTVDNSFAPGIGKRLDGWTNRELNVGAIVSLAPNLKPFTDLLGGVPRRRPRARGIAQPCAIGHPSQWPLYPSHPRELPRGLRPDNRNRHGKDYVIGPGPWMPAVPPRTPWVGSSPAPTALLTPHRPPP